MPRTAQNPNQNCNLFLTAHGRSYSDSKFTILSSGSINIGTLTSRGRELAQIIRDRNINIDCIQETKLKGVIYYGKNSILS